NLQVTLGTRQVQDKQTCKRTRRYADHHIKGCAVPSTSPVCKVACDTPADNTTKYFDHRYRSKYSRVITIPEILGHKPLKQDERRAVSETIDDQKRERSAGYQQYQGRHKHHRRAPAGNAF